MKLFVVIFSFLSLNINAQSSYLSKDSLFSSGNNTFSFTVDYLESFLLNSKTFNELEETFGSFIRPLRTDDTIFFSNGELKITMPYKLTGTDFAYGDLSISYNRTHLVKEISFYLKKSYVKDFIDQMNLNKYLFDENTNKKMALNGSKRNYYTNKSKSILISLYAVDDQTTSVYFASNKN